jgi:hypothetical protein
MELISNINPMLDYIRQPWHWAVSGAAITLVMALMIWMGRSFGVSTSFKAICAAAGAGRRHKFFDINVKDEFWRLSFVAGGLLGGFLTATFLQSPEPVAISESTVEYLSSVGLSYPESDALGRGFVPTELLNFSSLKGVLLALAGGFLVGFGARYGDGCTSGHAITGLSNLQLPSLITVIGFFIGGLLMTHLIFPFLVAL